MATKKKEKEATAPKAKVDKTSKGDHDLGRETGLHHEDGKPTGKAYVDPNAPKDEPK